MKSKILLLCVLFVGIMSVSATVMAQPAIINDIVIDTQDSSVKLTITSSQTLQIETFKNDESPANYIVLDFIGTVYTNLPSIIDVGKGAVEKVSLVRGEESQISIDGEPYYSLDFLAINLTSAADYRVSQSKSVIDLSIGDTEVAKVAEVEKAAAASFSTDKAVELSPPIVVSRKQKTIEPVETNYAYPSYEQSAYASKYEDSSLTKETATIASEEKPEEVKELTRTERREIASQKRKAKLAAKRAASSKQKSRTEKTKGGFLFFGKRSEPTETKEVVPDEKELVVRKVVVKNPQTEKENYLIDSIVNETIREKQKTSDRIEDLTMELKNLQQALYLSKGQKSQLDEKINEILAKLDQLKSSLDEEIRRRQALGEKVDDLIAQRNAYIKAKKDYEDFQMQLNRVSASVDDLNTEVKKVSSNLDLVRFEKKKLENDVNAMESEYTQIKTGYENALKVKDAITVTVEKLSREIDELRQKLDKTIEDKNRIVADLKNFENQSKYSGAELARLKQLLLDKNAILVELAQRYDQLKTSLDLAVSEKFKVEYSYRNAKTEFERIKREIETYLQNNK
ncbi:MAG: hypothetical protein V1747_00880 [Candidatus Omnitrophota bacterium]